jgi:hypothetical protein
MEKIKLKQVEEEYFKLIESKENAPTAQPTDTAQGAQSNQTIAGLFTPTPEQQKLLQHKQELAQALLETSPPDTQINPILRMPTPPDQSVLFQLETLPNLVENASVPKDTEEETAGSAQKVTQGRNTVRPSIKVSVQ